MLSVVMMTDVIPRMAMLSVYMLCCYGDNCNAECQYADCGPLC
jgi:hypothetical protein